MSLNVAEFRRQVIKAMLSPRKPGGEKVVTYPAVGQVMKDTIAALIAYPFG